MSETIPAPDGATRLFLILGDPIAQVKAPGGISLTFAARGVHAMLLPLHIAAADLRACVAGLSRARNLDGLVVTVPHKIAMAGHCATLSPRARLLGSVNLLRRNPDRGWHGDMSDGEGMLAAIRAAGGSPRGQRALLVGAGEMAATTQEFVVFEGQKRKRSVLLGDLLQARKDKLEARSREIAAQRSSAVAASAASAAVVTVASKKTGGRVLTWRLKADAPEFLSADEFDGLNAKELCRLIPEFYDCAPLRTISAVVLLRPPVVRMLDMGSRAAQGWARHSRRGWLLSPPAATRPAGCARCFARTASERAGERRGRGALRLLSTTNRVVSCVAQAHSQTFVVCHLARQVVPRPRTTRLKIGASRLLLLYSVRAN